MLSKVHLDHDQAHRHQVSFLGLLVALRKVQWYPLMQHLVGLVVPLHLLELGLLALHLQLLSLLPALHLMVLAPVRFSLHR